MAGNARDLVKRATVRKFLRKKDNREMSDREVARQCSCSKFLVKSVRMDLMAASLHEPIKERTQLGHEPNYKPGSSVRGGYVYGYDGKIIRDIEWIKQQARSGKRTSQV